MRARRYLDGHLLCRESAARLVAGDMAKGDKSHRFAVAFVPRRCTPLVFYPNGRLRWLRSSTSFLQTGQSHASASAPENPAAAAIQRSSSSEDAAGAAEPTPAHLAAAIRTKLLFHGVLLSQGSASVRSTATTSPVYTIVPSCSSCTSNSSSHSAASSALYMERSKMYSVP